MPRAVPGRGHDPLMSIQRTENGMLHRVLPEMAVRRQADQLHNSRSRRYEPFQGGRQSLTRRLNAFGRLKFCRPIDDLIEENDIRVFEFSIVRLRCHFLHPHKQKIFHGRKMLHDAGNRLGLRRGLEVDLRVRKTRHCRHQALSRVVQALNQFTFFFQGMHHFVSLMRT